MNVSPKLDKLSDSLSFSAASQLLSALISEAVEINRFSMIAHRRLPLYLAPSDPENCFFLGFTETNLKNIAPEIESLSRHETITLKSPNGGIPSSEQATMLLPYLSPALTAFPRILSSKASDGETYFWMLWKHDTKECVSFSPYMSTDIELHVHPKDVYELANLLNSDSWPSAPKPTPPTVIINAFSSDASAMPVTIEGAITTLGDSEAPQAGKGGLQAADIKPSVFIILGALLDLIAKDSKPKNQTWATMSIVDKFSGIRGLSESNIQKVFAEANSALTEALKAR